jgi:hypothetical protein
MLNGMSRSMALNGFFIAILATYLAQIHSPLRLAGDSPVYLCDAADLVDGKGFHDEHLPRGYPYALAALDSIGLGSNAGIVALNLVSIAAGLVCVSTVLRRELGMSKREVSTICVLCCCSWMWVQLATFPLSDLLFFALSSAVLAMLSLAKERSTLQAGLCLATAVLLASAAFLVRTIGAALFVAVAIAVLNTQAVRNILGRRGAIGLLAIGAGIAACVGLARPHLFASPWYAGSLSYLTAMKHPWSITQEIVAWRIGEVGELAQNVSSTAFAPTTATLPLDSVSPRVFITLQLQALRLAVGFVSTLLILAGLWSRRRQFSMIEGYLAAYVGILLIWPFDDTRFLAPVLPLLFAYAWLGLCSLKPKPQTLRRLVVCYSVVFCFFGAVAMGDSLRVTYLDRLRPWRECKAYMIDIPAWLTAYDRYGGLRPHSVESRDKPERVVP